MAFFTTVCICIGTVTILLKFHACCYYSKEKHNFNIENNCGKLKLCSLLVLRDIFLFHDQIYD